MATPRAGEVGVAGQCRTPPIPLQRSAGLKSSYWSWRRHCRRCEPSGTSRGYQRQRTCTKTREVAAAPPAFATTNGSKRGDAESHQDELAAAGWACLGPTLLVRAQDGGEHADDEGLTPGQRRKLSTDLADRCVDWALACVRARFVVS